MKGQVFIQIILITLQRSQFFLLLWSKCIDEKMLKIRTESHNINPWIYYTWHGSMASDFLKYFSTLETAHAWQDFCFISGNVTKLISSQCSQEYSFFGNLCDYINCSIMSPNKMWSFWTHFTKHRPILIIFLSSQQVHSRYVDNIYKYLHK